MASLNNLCSIEKDELLARLINKKRKKLILKFKIIFCGYPTYF
jgi:hypothetical protein